MINFIEFCNIYLTPVFRHQKFITRIHRSKRLFCTKTRFYPLILNIPELKIQIRHGYGMVNLVNTHLRPKIPEHLT